MLDFEALAEGVPVLVERNVGEASVGKVRARPDGHPTIAQTGLFAGEVHQQFLVCRRRVTPLALESQISAVPIAFLIAAEQ